jgi:hypothetical protein
MDPTSMRLYTARLSRENSTDVLAALQKVAEMPRAEYETAVPALGTILAMVAAEETARKNRTVAKQSERLVRWECPTCLVTLSGFPTSSEDVTNKRCQSKYKPFTRGERRHESLPLGQICGARMNVVLDENDETAGEVVPYQAPEWMSRSGAK